MKIQKLLKKTFPDKINPHFASGCLFYEEAQYEHACTAFRAYLEDNPESVQGLQKLGETHIKLENYGDAKRVLKKALSIESENSWLHVCLGNVYRGLEQWSRAEEVFGRILKTFSDVDLGWCTYGLGESLVKQKKFDKAIEVLQNAIDLNPDFEWAHYYLGVALSAMGDTAGAIDSYHKALDIRPLQSIIKALSDIYLKAGDNRKSAELWHTFKEIGKEAPENTDLKNVAPMSLEAILDSESDGLVSEDEIWPCLLDTPNELFAFRRILESMARSHLSWGLIQWLRNNSDRLGKTKTIYGGVYSVCGNLIKGWAISCLTPDDPVVVELWAGGRAQVACLANCLVSLPLIGNCGFELVVPEVWMGEGKSTDQLFLKVGGKSAIIDTVQPNMELKGAVTVLNRDFLAGWVSDLGSHCEQSLKGDLWIDGLWQAHVEATVVSPKKRPKAKKRILKKCAFHVTLDLDDSVAHIVEIKLPGTGLNWPGFPRVWMPDHRVDQILQRLGQNRTTRSCMTATEEIWWNQVFLPKLCDRLRRNKRLKLKGLLQGGVVLPAFRPEHTVDVIVPCYRDWQQTSLCLSSILAAHNQTRFCLTVIDDGSLDMALKAGLQRLAANNRIALITHRLNRGYVHSVNEGMQIHLRRDVVLLNSDTVVADGWLDCLRNAAYSSPRTASATPLSNHASIFSYPDAFREGPMPAEMDVYQLSGLAAEANGEEVVETPVAHGFCCYLRRDALVEVGLFDNQKWGRGYGEEVEWSLRARDRSWRHVCATGTFVEHAGNKSFGKQGYYSALRQSGKKINKHFPGYDKSVAAWIAKDPLSGARSAMLVSHLNQKERPAVLLVNHHLGGGTEFHVKERSQAISRKGETSLTLTPQPKGTSRDIWLKLRYAKDCLDARYRAISDMEKLAKDLKTINVKRIEVHHFLGFPLYWHTRFLKRLDLPFDIILHDYFVVCPRITLYQPGVGYCGLPDRNFPCDRCLSQFGANPTVVEAFGPIHSITDWRSRWAALLEEAATVVVPSQSALEQLKDFVAGPIRVVPHAEPYYAPVKNSQNPDPETIRLGVIGAISLGKGAYLLNELVRASQTFGPKIEWVLIGYSVFDEAIEGYPNVTISGPYEHNQLPELIKNAQLDGIFIPSEWPETFCYTLSEAQSTGLPVIAPARGAMLERLDGKEGSLLIHDLASERSFILDQIYVFLKGYKMAG